MQENVPLRFPPEIAEAAAALDLGQAHLISTQHLEIDWEVEAHSAGLAVLPSLPQTPAARCGTSCWG